MSYTFAPERYADQLGAIIDELLALDDIDAAALQKILRRYPKDERGLFAKSEIIRGFRHLKESRQWSIAEEAFLERLRMKPIRSMDG